MQRSGSLLSTQLDLNDLPLHFETRSLVYCGSTSWGLSTIFGGCYSPTALANQLQAGVVYEDCSPSIGYALEPVDVTWAAGCDGKALRVGEESSFDVEAEVVDWHAVGKDLVGYDLSDSLDNTFPAALAALVVSIHGHGVLAPEKTLPRLANWIEWYTSDIEGTVAAWRPLCLGLLLGMSES